MIAPLIAKPTPMACRKVRPEGVLASRLLQIALFLCLAISPRKTAALCLSAETPLPWS